MALIIIAGLILFLVPNQFQLQVFLHCYQQVHTLQNQEGFAIFLFLVQEFHLEKDTIHLILIFEQEFHTCFCTSEKYFFCVLPS